MASEKVDKDAQNRIDLKQFSKKMELARKILKNLENNLIENVVGQERAIRHLMRALVRYYVGASKLGTGPILSAFFAGPTGSGKTFLAEEFARFWIGDIGKRPPLTVIQCAMLGQSHESALLIGSPPGYVRSDEAGLLSQKNIDKYAELVKDKEDEILFEKLSNDFVSKHGKSLSQQDEKEPWKFISNCNPSPLKSVILFDEIEKAHFDIWAMFLHILSEGWLQMMDNSVTDFTNSIIIITSNIGTSEILHGKIGFDSSEIINPQKQEKDVYHKVKSAIEKRFYLLPEFIGRLSQEIVVFRPLTIKDYEKILDNNLKKLQQEYSGGIENQQIPLRLSFSERVKNFLLKEGFSERYGARNLNKIIEKFILTKISEGLIAERIKPSDKVNFIMKNNEPYPKKEEDVVNQEGLIIN